MVFQCPNRVYNAWRGPFLMNLEEFRNYLEINYDSFGYKSFFSFHWLYFSPEYIHIEFGKNVIDSSANNSFQYTYRQAIYGRVTYTYNRVIEPTINKRYTRLYLKFVSYEKLKHQIYHPYQFQSLNINTLQCIVEQLNVSTKEVLDWHNKSLYIKKIEDIYNSNSSVLSMTLSSKCGIVIGYFYKPKNEIFFPGDLYLHHELSDENENNVKYIYFPSFPNSYYYRPANWLHERLMSLNDEYRYKWEWQEFINQEEERQRHLSFLIAEESEYQQREYGHDISRILQRITSASPYFIALFRLADPQIANIELLYENCSICLDDFQFNRRFAQWLCKARHTFHFDCMLNVLRAGNKCPLCRHPVEPASLPSIETIIPLIAQRTMNTIFS
ncbi:unnamed protein product [Rotaria sp. Silwood1]|nr:unnamed protein product [Rotaria sp. Silwood1]